MAKRAAAPTVTTLVDRVRATCLACDGASERPSHGAPAFFVDNKQFAVIVDNHHGDGIIAVFCAAAPGIQAMVVDSDPRIYYVPPYVGHLGWLGIRLDRGPDWPAVAALLESAHEHRRKKSISRRRSTGTSASRPPSSPRRPGRSRR